MSDLMPEHLRQIEQIAACRPATAPALAKMLTDLDAAVRELYQAIPLEYRALYELAVEQDPDGKYTLRFVPNGTAPLRPLMYWRYIG